MIWAKLVIPKAVIMGRSLHENFLYRSMNGISMNDIMNSNGHSSPVTNLSYCVRMKA